jgi:hypothetical protein
MVAALYISEIPAFRCCRILSKAAASARQSQMPRFDKLEFSD